MSTPSITCIGSSSLLHTSMQLQHVCHTAGCTGTGVCTIRSVHEHRSVYPRTKSDALSNMKTSLRWSPIHRKLHCAAILASRPVHCDHPSIEAPRLSCDQYARHTPSPTRCVSLPAFPAPPLVAHARCDRKCAALLGVLHTHVCACQQCCRVACTLCACGHTTNLEHHVPQSHCHIVKSAMCSTFLCSTREEHLMPEQHPNQFLVQRYMLTKIRAAKPLCVPMQMRLRAFSVYWL